MGKLKSFFKWIVSNKKSLAGTIVNAAGTGLGVTAVWTLESLPVILIDGFNVAPIIYTVVFAGCFVLNELGICGKGFESVKVFIERKQREKDEAETKAIEAEAQKQLAAAEAEAKAIELAAKEQIKAEEERKKEAERTAKIERKKAELLAQMSKR